MVFVVLNGICAATAYQTHYRALELGRSRVSPIGSAYAVIGVLLAVFPRRAARHPRADRQPRDRRRRGARLDRSPRAPRRIARRRARSVARRAVGARLDRLVRAGRVPAGLPLAALGMGRRALGIADGTGDLLHPLGVHRQEAATADPYRRGLLFALIAALADIVGVIGLSVGIGAGVRLGDARRERGLPACRRGPLDADLDERLVPNQYVGSRGGRGIAVAGRLVCDGLLSGRREELDRDTVGVARCQHTAVSRHRPARRAPRRARSGGAPMPPPRRGPRTRSTGGRARRSFVEAAAGRALVCRQADHQPALVPHQRADQGRAFSNGHLRHAPSTRSYHLMLRGRSVTESVT